MRYIETPNDCLITPMRRGSQSQSQPDMSDVFMETPIGMGSSTRLEGMFQPNWDALDKELTDLEYMSRKADSIYSTQVKQGYRRMMTTLATTEKELQLRGQLEDTLSIDSRETRLYRTTELRQSEVPDISPTHYGVLSKISGEKEKGAAGGADPSISILDPIECQEAPVANRGEYRQRYDICQEIGAPGVCRDEDGQTRVFSSAASQVVGSNGQLAAYTPGLCQEARPLYADSADSGKTRNGVGQVVYSNGKPIIYNLNIGQEARSLPDIGDSGRTGDAVGPRTRPLSPEFMLIGNLESLIENQRDFKLFTLVFD